MPFSTVHYFSFLTSLKSGNASTLYCHIRCICMKIAVYIRPHESHLISFTCYSLLNSPWICQDPHWESASDPLWRQYNRRTGYYFRRFGGISIGWKALRGYDSRLLASPNGSNPLLNIYIWNYDFGLIWASIFLDDFRSPVQFSSNPYWRLRIISSPIHHYRSTWFVKVCDYSTRNYWKVLRCQ